MNALAKAVVRFFLQSVIFFLAYIVLGIIFDLLIFDNQIIPTPREVRSGLIIAIVFSAFRNWAYYIYLKKNNQNTKE